MNGLDPRDWELKLLVIVIGFMVGAGLVTGILSMIP